MIVSIKKLFSLGVAAAMVFLLCPLGTWADGTGDFTILNGNKNCSYSDGVLTINGDCALSTSM